MKRENFSDSKPRHEGTGVNERVRLESDTHAISMVNLIVALD
jgi:hypothetical protein